VKTDSDIERKFASDLECEEVLVYAKLPGGPNGFKIPTPLGNYNPDWAIVVEDSHKLYLVRETKSTLDRDKQRVREIEENPKK